MTHLPPLGVSDTRPNQVWAMDITYIPMARGFVYLAAVVDWFTRRVLSWRLTDQTMPNMTGDVLAERLREVRSGYPNYHSNRLQHDNSPGKKQIKRASTNT
jgi:transposase InsO family protein